MDEWGEFAQKVKRLLSEWMIVGRKADTLTAALVALVRDEGTLPDKVMADLTTIRAGAVKRATVNPAGLTVHIIAEYCETGQIALFDVQPDSQPALRPGQKRQVSYTPEQRAAAEERSRQRLAERARVPKEDYTPEELAASEARAEAYLQKRQRAAEVTR